MQLTWWLCLTIKAWPWRPDREGLTMKVWPWKSDRESLTVKAWPVKSLLWCKFEILPLGWGQVVPEDALHPLGCLSAHRRNLSMGALRTRRGSIDWFRSMCCLLRSQKLTLFPQSDAVPAIWRCSRNLTLFPQSDVVPAVLICGKFLYKNTFHSYTGKFFIWELPKGSYFFNNNQLRMLLILV